MANEPIFEAKPSYAGFTLNLNEIWRRVRRRSPAPTVEDVAKRFLLLFNEHGIATAQIPRWIDSLSLADLNDTARLLGVLTPVVLEKAAQIFGIQRTWLEGSSQQIYSTHFCYKKPDELFRLLDELQLGPHSYPVRIITSCRTLNFRQDVVQPLALIVVEKIADAEGVENIRDIDRYHIFCDGWDWGYFNTRVQLKAMARAIDQILCERVPLYQVTEKELGSVQEGRLIPRRFFNRSPLTEPSLDDYANSRLENAHAKETEELPAVLQYMASMGIEAIARNVRRSNAS